MKPFTMKIWLTLFIFALIYADLNAQNEINLIIRADDIGSSHNANLACIEAYQKGIARSVEIMVPCPWFEEAVKMLNENPGFDVGVHLTLTSEWSNYKWRPLTHAPSICDEDGYFYPMIWPNDNYSEKQALHYANWDLKEVENELRAQIELAKKKVPQISHLSSHMGWTSVDHEFAELWVRLAKEYNLDINMDGVKSLPGYEKGATTKETIVNFNRALENLEPGTYLFVEHPGLNTPEAKAIGHIGYETVAKDRQLVTDLFTDASVMKTIKKKNIKLIAYKDLKEK